MVLGPASTGAAALCAAVLALLALRAGVSAAGVGWRRGRALARRTAAALRPRVLRRALAALTGLAAPLLTQVSPASASAAPQTALVADAPHPRPDAATRTVTAVYVVVHGDTLWDIARRHLPAAASDADVARAWPRWWSANRSVIGPDPGRLVSGMRLRVPGGRTTGTSSAQPPPSAATLAATSLDPDRR